LIASSWEELPERYAMAPVYHDVAKVIGWESAIAFGLAVWREKRSPSRMRGGGPGYIYIPTKLTARCGLTLVRLAGLHAAELLVNEFPGSALWFPHIVSASIGRRNRAIVKQVVEEGLRQEVVAAGFGLTTRQIRRIKK
jgi:hypothetical protein